MPYTLHDILASPEAMDAFVDEVAGHHGQGEGGVRTNFGFCSPAELDQYLKEAPATSPEQEQKAAAIIVDAVKSYD